MKLRKKLIEVALPLEAINIASAREKNIRHGHPSTLHLWWARRPLAAARAVIFSQMVDDPSGYANELLAKATERRLATEELERRRNVGSGRKHYTTRLVGMERHRLLLPGQNPHWTNVSLTWSASASSTSSGSLFSGRTPQTKMCSLLRVKRSGRAGAVPAPTTRTILAPKSYFNPDKAAGFP